MLTNLDAMLNSSGYKAVDFCTEGFVVYGLEKGLLEEEGRGEAE